MTNFKLYLILFFIFSITNFSAEKPKSNSKLEGINWAPSPTFLNINNISTKLFNNGQTTLSNGNGFQYPKGSFKHAVFESGVLWGARIDGELRIGGSAYGSSLQPGKILSSGTAEDPNLSKNRIYRVRRDIYPGGPEVDLSYESIDEGNSVSAIRDQYEMDWIEWPANDGAPYIDIDNDEIYNHEIDIPGVEGADQTIWYVANDLDHNLSLNFYGRPPIGVEMQTTLWAYNQPNTYANMYFRKYKLINKSQKDFNDMYVTMWANADMGFPENDFVGCDTLLNMVYTYNADEEDVLYNPMPPPAYGIDLVQGPVKLGISGEDKNRNGVDDGIDYAIYDGKLLGPGKINLPMTASYYFVSGDFVYDMPVNDLHGAEEFYNLMQGKLGTDGRDFIDPTNNLITTYPLNGDPISNSGWVDGIHFPTGERGMGLASGPFNLAIGDTQEVVFSEIGGIGIDQYHPIKLLRYYSSIEQQSYDNFNHQNSFKLTSETEFGAEVSEQQILLNWNNSDIENFDSSGYKFQGYNIYQIEHPPASLEPQIKLATFDVIDGLTQIIGQVMDPNTGYPMPGIQMYGSDSGIITFVLADKDHFTDAEFIIGKVYTYAIGAYAYNENAITTPKIIESNYQVINVEYKSDLPGPGFGDSISVEHTQGLGELGRVVVKVADPTKLTGDDYNVRFKYQQVIRNENGDWIPVGSNNKNGFNKISDISESTVDMAAVYAEVPGAIEISCLLNLIAPDDNWADGVKMIFPNDVQIIDAPEFEAGGGTVTPVIEGSTVNLGLVNNAQTANGIFHGNEEWSVIINSFTPPILIEYEIFDDNWAGTPMNAVGSNLIEEIGYATKFEHQWHLINTTTLDTALKAQTIINGFDLYTNQYLGNPIVDGLEINVDVDYSLLDYSEINIIGSGSYDIKSYTQFGFESSLSYEVFGNGTQDINELSKDYELRFTGEYINESEPVVYVKEGTGSIATIYGARGYSLADHPMNPNPGIDAPFHVRIPFEVWNIDDNRQVNILIYDRAQHPTTSVPFYAFNPGNRMYAEILNTAYDSTTVNSGDPENPDTDYLTWNLVFWETDWDQGDKINVIYRRPISSADIFSFSTPDPIVSVEEDIIPIKYNLSQNFPNPFNPATKIRFHLPDRSSVKLEVFNILGQKVKTLLNTEFEPGIHEINFNGINLSSGVYFYRLEAGQFSEVKKMLLMK